MPMRRPHGPPRFGLGSTRSTPARHRPYRGQRRVAAFMPQPDVAREIEYLEQALEEAEAAARWYAERSATAAVAFSDEIDAAESAIARLPDAWPLFDGNTRRY